MLVYLYGVCCESVCLSTCMVFVVSLYACVLVLCACVVVWCVL